MNDTTIEFEGEVRPLRDDEILAHFSRLLASARADSSVYALSFAARLRPTADNVRVVGDFLALGRDDVLAVMETTLAALVESGNLSPADARAMIERCCAGRS